MHVAQRRRLRMRVSLQHFLDHIADVAVAHVRLTQRVLVDARQLAHRVADDRVAQIQLALIAVGERSCRKKHGGQRQGLIVEAGEVLAEQPRLLQLAAGGADRLARPGQCLHGPTLCNQFPSPACGGGQGGGCQPVWIWSACGALMTSPLLYLSKVSVMFWPPVWVATYLIG